MRADPVGEQWIRVQQEAPLRDSVRLVVELLREELVKLLQLLVFQNLGVQLCHTVDGIARRNRQMRHLHLSVIDDRHFLDHVPVAGEARLNL